MKKLYFLFFVLPLPFIGTSQSCLPEGKTFSSQYQIDHFSSTYPGCKEIEGDVTIQGNDITNLNGLKVLTALGGNLSIGTYIGGNWDLDSLIGLDKITHIDGSFSIIGDGHLVNLMGLKSLSSVGGDLIIQANASLVNLAGLESLFSIGGELKISDNNKLISLTGIRNIDAASISALYIHDNNSLHTCEVQSVCNYLMNPNGSINIYMNATGCNSPLEAANACGISLSCLPHGNYYFNNQTDIDYFQINYPGCTELEGDLIISGVNITNVNGLNALISVEGNLTMGTYPEYNPNLASLSGLSNLNSVGRDIWIYGCYRLEDLTGLNNLGYVGGSVRISFNGNLISLTGLEDIVSLDSSLLIEGNNLLTNFSGLENLTSIGSRVIIYENDSLSSLTGLEHLTSIGGNLALINNFHLSEITSLGSLTYLGGNLLIGYNSRLTSLSGLEGLTSIGGYLDIDGQFSLKDLIGLQNITSIGGGLEIRSTYHLKSLHGLENIDPASISDLVIVANDSLSTCEVQSICDFLASPNGTIEIHHNATGCDSLEEVVAACRNGLPEDNLSGNLFTISPNPSSNLITIETSVSPSKFLISIFNLNGQEVISCQIAEHKAMIDISNLPGGVYFVRMTGENAVSTQKFIKID